MKKILFVATVSSHIIGFHIPYLKYFKEKGYEVHVASNGEEKIEYCDKHYNLPFKRFPLKKDNVITYKGLKRIINENSYDIIHCHTPVGAVLTRLAARNVRKKGISKVIYTAHGFHFYNGAPLKNWIIYYPIEKLCSRWTDCLITINNEDYELAKKKLKNIKRIELVHGVGINTEKFKKELSNIEKREKRIELGLFDNDIILTYVAELNKNKNQILLIEILRELKEKYSNIKLLLVGDGVFSDTLKNQIEEGLQENVILLGRRKDINEILSITDIYVASSIREGLPVNIMEAMYKGLPIVATNNRGHRELVLNEQNGYIVENKEQFKNKIIEFIQDKEKRNTMGKRAREIVRKYELNNVIKEMEKIYLLVMT